MSASLPTVVVALLATVRVQGDVVVKRVFGQSNEDGSASSSLRNDGRKILLYSIVFSSVGLFLFLMIVTKLCAAVLQRRKFNNSSVKPEAPVPDEDETQLLEKEGEEAKDGGKLDESVRPKRKIRIKLGKSGTSFSTHQQDHQELPPLVLKGSMNA